MKEPGVRLAFIATAAPLSSVSSVLPLLGIEGAPAVIPPSGVTPRPSRPSVKQSKEDQVLGTHFDLSLGHGPDSWSKSRRDHARGLLSQQWNTGFP